MKILVTGANGFIGSHLVDHLARSGAEVFALLRPTSRTDLLQGKTYRPVFGSLEDDKSLSVAVRGMDVIYHLAGVTAASSREIYFRVNTEGTRRLADAVWRENPHLKRFVLVSSLAAGGPAQSLSPRLETEPDSPVSAYGESKKHAENEILSWSGRFPITIVRPPMVYGPGDRAVFLFIRSVKLGLVPMLTSSGSEGKHYSAIHVSDLVDGLRLSAQSSVPSGEVFYLADDRVYPFHEVMKSIQTALGKRNVLRVPIPITVLKVGARLRISPFLTDDKLNELIPDYWICSNQKAKNILGFQPKFDLASGMLDAIQWYRKENWI